MRPAPKSYPGKCWIETLLVLIYILSGYSIIWC